ncbi:MAG: hypothetical protein LBH44_03070 [Treponema sp.]|jgi:hypothetical protein|nr:hypothetical protein [Treponema sp.]
MSDTGTKEKRQFSLEEKLEHTYKRLLTTSIFFGIGWIVFCILAVLLVPSGYNEGPTFFVMFVGMAVVSSPIIVRMWNGGFKGAFNLPEYEVITTYEDGRKESDHGVESGLSNLAVQIVLSIIMVIVGFAVTLIYIVFLLIKYTVLFLRVNVKPSFIKSGYFIVIITAAVFFGSMHIGGAIKDAKEAPFKAEEKAKMEKRISELADAIQIGQKVTITNDAGLRDGKGEDYIKWGTIKRFKKGDIVTIKSKEITASRNELYIYAEHDGDIGYVNVGYTDLKK